MNAAIGTMLLLAVGGFVLWIGLAGPRGGELRSEYLAARRQLRTGTALAISLLASAAGATVLFAPAEIGASFGLVGVVGFGVAAACPFLVLACVGPIVRSRVPDGVTLLDWIGQQHGRLFQTYVAVVSLMFMFLFLTAELRAIGIAAELLMDVDADVATIVTAGAAIVYVSSGGLTAVLRTDRWQGGAVVAFVAVIVATLVIDIGTPLGAASDSGLLSPTRPGIEAFAVLAIAITASTLLHQGYWQRVWATRDAGVLRRGSIGGGALLFGVTFLLGFAGIVERGFDSATAAPLTLFSLIDSAPGWLAGAALVLAVALVTGSIDSLQSGMVALVVTDLYEEEIPLSTARTITLVVTLPAVVIAVQGLSVVRLLLIAELIASVTIGPTLLSLWRRSSVSATVASTVAGVVGVITFAWLAEGKRSRSHRASDAAERVGSPGVRHGAHRLDAGQRRVVDHLARTPQSRRDNEVPAASYHPGCSKAALRLSLDLRHAPRWKPAAGRAITRGCRAGRVSLVRCQQDPSRRSRHRPRWRVGPIPS